MKDDSESYYESREFQDILKSYESMLDEGTSTYFDGMDLANIAQYYALSSELEKSDRVIEYGLSIHPADPDILIAKAGNQLQRGLSDQARVIAESIDSQDNQELIYLKGCIELADGNPEQADRFYTTAVEMSENDSGMINDIIVKFMDTRHFELCQKWLDKALVLEPDSRNFIELQADLFFDTGQMDTALTWYDNLLDEFPFDTYYWEQMGRIHYEKNEFAKARECFEYIEAIDPDNKSARMMCASCIFSLELWDDALEIYTDLLKEDSDSYTLLYYCGRCKFEKGLYSESLPYFQQSFESLTHEDDEIPTEMLVELYGYMAESALRSGQTKYAVQLLADGLALDPQDQRLIYVSGLLLEGPFTDFSDNKQQEQ
ncbi:MAG: tetratricopeptide repeat protein [Bacteroidaceae bacterium]|nr:tetratricopeptide repeat protein [Bacteroidaceae bacterium]